MEMIRPTGQLNFYIWNQVTSHEELYNTGTWNSPEKFFSYVTYILFRGNFCNSVKGGASKT